MIFFMGIGFSFKNENEIQTYDKLLNYMGIKEEFEKYMEETSLNYYEKELNEISKEEELLYVYRITFFDGYDKNILKDVRILHGRMDGLKDKDDKVIIFIEDYIFEEEIVPYKDIELSEKNKTFKKAFEMRNIINKNIPLKILYGTEE